MKKRLEALKRDEKGFTLVELIVVLVILAILAALLVPALLGYIDRARQGKYLEEARSIYTAIQAVQDEKYAKGDPAISSLTGTDLTEVNNLVDPTKVTSASIGSFTQTGRTANGHDAYVVSTLQLQFVSQDGKTITANMADNGDWTVTLPDSSGTNNNNNNNNNNNDSNDNG